MKRVRQKVKASKLSSEDIISSMPKKVIADILDRLPIQDAVRTGILSRNWRFNWTMLTQLVFDLDFIDYLERRKDQYSFYTRNLSNLLLHLKGGITKFVLYVPKKKDSKLVIIEDIGHWVLFLSTKGIKEFTLVNMSETPLNLPTHFFSCLKLKHLRLQNCCFRPPPRFHGFPNLLTFECCRVRFESCTYGEFITRSPSLEIMKYNDINSTGKVKPFEIARLGNLKTLSLLLCKLDSVVITSSDILRLMCSLPKLEELDLDFKMCKFLGEAGARKRILATFHSLKILTLKGIDLNNHVKLLCAFDLIRGSLNLQTLKITATQGGCVSPPPLCSWEDDCGIMMKLRIVELECIRGSENEICLIKSLLANSPLLKKMVINRTTSPVHVDCHENLTFAKKLLKLHRASPITEINLF